MTFGEKRAGVRALRTVVRMIDEAQDAAFKVGGLNAAANVSLAVPAEEYDRAAWAMGHVKAWHPEEQRYIRVNLRFVKTGESRPHFHCRGCVVFRDDVTWSEPL